MPSDAFTGKNLAAPVKVAFSPKFRLNNFRFEAFRLKHSSRDVAKWQQ